MNGHPATHAIAYARLGWHVLPLQPGAKTPLSGQGLKHATRDEQTIAAWFRDCPSAGVGIALEPSGLAAVDIDPRNGGDLELRDRLPATLTAATGGDGLHLVYRVPQGARVRSSLGPGIDVKHRGYIAAEPSLHPSGKRYSWLDFEPVEGESPDIADAPAELFEPEPQQRESQADDTQAFAEGGRNAALTRLAGKLRRAGLSPEAIGVALLRTNVERCRPPLPDDEVHTIAASVGRYATGEHEQAPPADIYRSVAAPPLDPGDFPPIVRRFAALQAAAAGHDVSAYLLAALAAGSGAISDAVRVRLDTRSAWVESPRLWVMLCGGPGTGKTPAIRAAMQPLFVLHRRLVEEHARACEALDDDEPKPSQPAVFVSDTTIEALSEKLAATPRGVLAVFEELDSWIGSHDCYRGGQGSRDRGEWLRLFDGGPHQVDRIKRGSYFVENWGAGILGGTTPAGLQRHAKDLPPDGLIQRFLPLIVRGMSEPDDIDAEAVESARGEYNGLLRDVFALPACTIDMAPEAQVLFAERRAELRREVEAASVLGDAFAAHLAKHAGLLGRVALVMHCLTHGEYAGGVSIEPETVQSATRILRKLAKHALAVFDTLAGGSGPLDLARAVGAAVLAERLATLTRNDLLQHCKAFRQASTGAREAALLLLVDAGWLTPDEGGRMYAGRAAVFGVNAEVHARFGAAGEQLRARRAAVREMFNG
ncbi:MAG: DUF3987 domain-containing protein [Burkholderiaceae bacterium]|jgi:hypothetical protein|nr:DUF3987 domain-containing protein [Burkholderiaceae bacterium]